MNENIVSERGHIPSPPLTFSLDEHWYQIQSIRFGKEQEQEQEEEKEKRTKIITRTRTKLLAKK